MTVKYLTVSRLSGIAAMLAGAIFIAIQPIHPADVLESVTSPAWMVVTGLKLMMCLLFLVGLTGLYLRQLEEASWPGLLGFGLLFFSFWLQTAFVFLECFVLPVLAGPDPAFVRSVLSIINGSVAEMDVTPLVVGYAAVGISYLLGGVLFGIATLRARVLPKWPAALLAVSAAITPAAALIPLQFQRYAAIPMGLSVILLGHSLWSERLRRSFAV